MFLTGFVAVIIRQETIMVGMVLHLFVDWGVKTRRVQCVVKYGRISLEIDYCCQMIIYFV